MSFAVPYRLSVALPIQMMGQGYVAWRRAEKQRRRRDEPVLRRSQRDRLEAPNAWPHPQLRALNKIAPASCLALPWIAPSLPCWDLQGPWSAPGASGESPHALRRDPVDGYATEISIDRLCG
jgi:hypothetical protein